MGYTVIYFISVLNMILSSSPFPECEDQSIIFTAEPADVEVDLGCGRREVAVFPCQYEGISALPQWIINESTVYSSLNSQLPPDYFYSAQTLSVTNLLTKNGTQYQCQLLVKQDSGIPCLHKSRSGRLIVNFCNVYTVKSLPYYHFGGSKRDKLNGINTTIFHSQIDVSIVVSYTITFNDSKTGSICGLDTIPASSCTDGICSHMFNVYSSSYCPNSTDINVTVSINNSHQSYLITNPIKIDAVNNFVKVSITSASEIIIKCTFINQSEEHGKSCAVLYGPISPGCENMSYYSKASVSETNSVEVGVPSINNSTNICFVVTASTDDKTVRVEGIYYTSGDGVNKHHIQPTTAMLIIFGALINMITYSIVN